MPPTVVSTSTVETVQGKHVFEIIGYSKHRGLGHDGNSYIGSRTFNVGDHDWAIRFYPDGFGEENGDYISVYLEFMSKNGKARASCDLRLVDHSTGSSSSVHRTEPRMFDYCDYSCYAPQTDRFMKRSELEASAYLQDDRLTIECVVEVMKEPKVAAGKPGPKIEVPRSDIGEHLGKLLESGDGADVTFSVRGETFAAHRFVLAVRSPVFKAELCGPMQESKNQSVAVKGMQPEVFKALLNFVYTDSLPTLDDLKGRGHSEMIQQLLVAADRYGMDRLKNICQSLLCKDLNVQNVATVLALADQHHCNMLMDACIEFISSSTIDAVVATKGFADLRRKCPSVLVDAFVKKIQKPTKK
ncbi:hypothetical protein ACP70R_003121 [Stipagrostis hirtigluma subsp. patula]